MHTMTLAGDSSSGLTYFALLGAGEVARSISNKPIRLVWTDETKPRARLLTQEIDGKTLAEAIQSLASRWSKGWASVRVKYATGEYSPFSPRFKVIDATKSPNDWDAHQAARIKQLDQLEIERDYLALDFIRGLGEAGYWRFTKNGSEPDHGASRWEMKTRNRGQEFITHRFHPMCTTLSEWSVEKILSGLKGASLNDTLDSSTTSRTSTGLTPPAPADVALSFVALIGLAAFPVLHRVHAISVTPCAFPPNALHSRQAVLPIPISPISPEKLEAILISRTWAQVVDEFGKKMTKGLGSEEIIDLAGRELLRSHGIPAAVVFDIRRGGTASAPERYFERGDIVLL